MEIKQRFFLFLVDTKKDFHDTFNSTTKQQIKYN